jgi:protein SCO1/2
LKIFFSLSLAFALLFLNGCTRLPIIPIGGEIALHEWEPHGVNFPWTQTQGKVTLVFFGFAGCPDFCPKTLIKIRQIAEQLKSKSSEVQLLFVEVDPGRDSKDRLQAYFSKFPISFHVLTGSDEELNAACKTFGAWFEKGKADAHGNYSVDHALTIYLLDQESRVRSLWTSEIKTETMLGEIKSLLK